MSKKNTYQQIKKQNGELFAHQISKYDNGLFEIKNLPQIVRYAGREATPLLKFLESLKGVLIEEVEIQKSPFELLQEAGYTSFWADTLQKQMSISPYFAPNEELCTFLDNAKFQRYFIIHCIKKGAENLKRKDFSHPQKEDEYAVSVLSIQILKEGGFIKIVNRYNNSDHTFDSNPDNIILGLSSALKKHFQVDFSSLNEGLPQGFVYQNGCIFKVHQETKGVYFGDGFYLKNGELFFINPDNQIIIDDFIIDLKEKTVFSPIKRDDNLTQLIQDEIKAKTLRISKTGHTKSLYANGQLILKTAHNRLTHLYLRTSTIEPNHIFYLHDKIEEFEAVNTTAITGSCFCGCENLKIIRMPKLTKSPDEFMMNLPKLVEVDMPSLEIMGKNNFSSLESLSTLILFSLKRTGAFCFSNLNQLTALSAPSLEVLGSNSIRKCFQLKKVLFQSLKECGMGCFYSNPSLEEIVLNNLIKTGDYCFSNLLSDVHFSLNALEEIGSNSFSNLGTKRLYLPRLKVCGDDVINKNKNLEIFDAPLLTTTGEGFLSKNPSLKGANLPSLLKIERDSIKSNKRLKVLKLDSLISIHSYTGIQELQSLDTLYAPRLVQELVFACFFRHKNAEKITSNFKNLNACASYFMDYQHD